MKLSWKVYLFFAFFGFSNTLHPSVDGSGRYKDVTKNVTTYLSLEFQQDSGAFDFLLFAESYRLELKGKGAQASIMTFSKPLEKLFITAKKQDQIVDVTIKQANNNLEYKKFDLEGFPWIQNFILLENIIKSGKKELVYWVFSDQDFSFKKMILKRRNLKTITLENKSFKARRYTFNVSGVPGFIWTAQVWFDDESGRFLLYKGLSGLPGSDKKVFSYVPHD